MCVKPMSAMALRVGSHTFSARDLNDVSVRMPILTVVPGTAVETSYLPSYGACIQ